MRAAPEPETEVDFPVQREEPVEPPSKFVSETHAVHMRCGLYYIDMEGLNDGRAVKTIVPQVNPRRLVSHGRPQNL